MTSAPHESSPLLERVRRLGNCPPSLLKWGLPNSFDEKVLGVLEDNGEFENKGFGFSLIWSFVTYFPYDFFIWEISPLPNCLSRNPYI